MRRDRLQPEPAYRWETRQRHRREDGAVVERDRLRRRLLALVGVGAEDGGEVEALGGAEVREHDVEEVGEVPHCDCGVGHAARGIDQLVKDTELDARPAGWAVLGDLLGV